MCVRIYICIYIYDLYMNICTYAFVHIQIIALKAMKSSKEVKKHHCVLTGIQRQKEIDQSQSPRGQQTFLLISFSVSSIMLYVIKNTEKKGLNRNFSKTLGRNHYSCIIHQKYCKARQTHERPANQSVANINL